jgi:hypothetical protein
MAAGLSDRRFGGTVSGYRFAVVANRAGFSAHARAENRNLHRVDLEIAADGVLRNSTEPRRAPKGKAGQPVR